MKILLLFIILTFNYHTFTVGKPKDEASERFRKYFSVSHPLPENSKLIKAMIPMAEPIKNPMFLNVPASVDESGGDVTQNESSIAINPKNPQNLIASAVDYRDNSSTWVYVSNDGGKSWINKNLGKALPNWRSSNDPSVTFDADGIGYLVYGGFGNIGDSTILFGENGVFLSRTSDGGNTWESHIPVILHRGKQTLDSNFEDKYYIYSDNSPSSPFFGRLYIPWKRVTPADSATQIVISYSTDKGKTWVSPINVSDRLAGSSEDTTFGQSFPLASSGPDGALYIVWNHGIEHGVGFAKSTDGGNNFTSPRIIQRYNIFGTTKMLEGQGFRHTVKGKVRAETYPVIVTDISSAARKGRIYLTWAGDSIPNIYFSYSDDKGDSWSLPKIIHNDIRNDQFWQWLAIDATNGDIAVMYFDSRNDDANMQVETYASYSSDGGETWIDRRVSDLNHDIRLNPFRNNSFAGDYSGCAFHNGMLYPSWVDMRHSVINIADNDVMTAVINTRAPLPPTDFKANVLPEEPQRLLLTFKQPTERSFGQKLGNEDYYLVLRRGGNEIAKIGSAFERYQDEGLTAFSEYHYELAAVAGPDTSLWVKTKAFAGGALKPLPPRILNVSGDDENNLAIGYLLPTMRIDSVTPIVRLSRVDTYIDQEEVAQTERTPSDTGKTFILKYGTVSKGYYIVSSSLTEDFAIPEIPVQISDLSNQVIAFTGSVTNSISEDFNSAQLDKYYYTENISQSDKFYFQGPYSIKFSGSEEEYSGNQRDTLMIFPIANSDVATNFRLSFYHAAFVQNRDSAIVEISRDRMQNWEIIGFFDKNQFEPWTDDMMSSDDWKPEEIEFPMAKGDTAFIRFRFRSDPFKHDKGWYIDNIRIEKWLSAIDSDIDKDAVIFPNPATNYITIRNVSQIAEIKIANSLGEIVSGWKYVAGGIDYSTLDISLLSSGVYILYAIKSGQIDKIIRFSVNK